VAIGAKKMHHKIEDTMLYTQVNEAPCPLLLVECHLWVWPVKSLTTPKIRATNPRIRPTTTWEPN